MKLNGTGCNNRYTGWNGSCNVEYISLSDVVLVVQWGEITNVKLVKKKPNVDTVTRVANMLLLKCLFCLRGSSWGSLFDFPSRVLLAGEFRFDRESFFGKVSASEEVQLGG